MTDKTGRMNTTAAWRLSKLLRFLRPKTIAIATDGSLTTSPQPAAHSCTHPMGDDQRNTSVSYRVPHSHVSKSLLLHVFWTKCIQISCIFEVRQSGDDIRGIIVLRCEKKNIITGGLERPAHFCRLPRWECWGDGIGPKSASCVYRTILYYKIINTSIYIYFYMLITRRS